MEAIILGGVLLVGILLGYYTFHKKQPNPAETRKQLETLAAEITRNLDRDNKEMVTKVFDHLEARSRADLQQRQTSIEALVKPISDTLEKTGQQIREIEKERKQDQGTLKEQLSSVVGGQVQLQKETARLVNALKNPQVRGRWGELTLQRTVELAGMQNYCDFEEQVQAEGGSQLRPDVIVYLPNERRVVIDAKTSLDSYLDALEKTHEEERRQCLEKHAQQLKAHVRDLSGKAYWRQFEDTLDFVVMFIPGEQFLTAALEHAPDMQENALKNNVILATPPTLVALLRAIAYGWRQKSLEKNAQEIRRLGEELYTRVATFSGHMGKVGKSLGGSISAYNAAVGSFERNLLPGAHKFVELGISKQKEITDLKPVESATRPLSCRPPEKSTGKDTEAIAEDESSGLRPP